VSEPNLEEEIPPPEIEQAPPSEIQAPPQAKKKKGKYVCKYCGQVFPTLQSLGAHSRVCPERRKQIEEQKRKEEGPLYKGEADSIRILDEILSKHPDITPRIKEEVLDWARLKNGLQPMELQQILTSFKGVSQNTAAIIASKYSFALMKAQQEGRVQLPWALYAPPPPQAPQLPIITPVPTTTPPTQTGYIAPPTTTPRQPYTTSPQWPFQTYSPPYYQPQYPPYPQQQTLSKEDVKSIIREEIYNFQRLIEQRERERTSELYVDIEEPIRSPDGKIIIDDKNKPIVRRLRVPVSQVHLFAPQREPTVVQPQPAIPEERFKELREEISRLRDELSRKEVEDLKKEIETLREQMKAPAQPTEPPIVAELKAKLEATEKRFEELKSKMEEEERKQMQQQISSLYEEVRRLRGELTSAKSVEGYKEDEMRIIGQGISELASIAKERKPIEVVIKEGIPTLIGLQGALQPQMQQLPQIRKKVGTSKVADMLPPELVEAG